MRAFESACSMLLGGGACILMVAGAGADDPPTDAWQVLDPVVQAANRGVALMERYEYGAAAAAFEQASKLAPESAELRVNLAIAIFNRAGDGDLTRAEQLLDGVLNDEPDNVRALYLRAITHQYGGRDAEALVLLQRVVKLAPSDAYSHYLLARSKSHLGRECRADLERTIELNPALVSTYYDLMRVAAQAGDSDAAREYQEQFTRLRKSPLHEMMVMPNYGQMGPLALVRPPSGTPPPRVAGGELTAGTPRVVFEAGAEVAMARDELLVGKGGTPPPPIPIALADANNDGRLDIVTAACDRDGVRRVRLLLGRPDGTFADATAASGLLAIMGLEAFAFGDYDNDGNIDLFMACRWGNHLFRGNGNGTFEDVTASTRTSGGDAISRSAVFLDADHDSDLDIFVCNVRSGRALPAQSDGVQESMDEDRLFNNNGDGTFTDIAESAGVARATGWSMAVAPADLDGDRDTDLVLFDGQEHVRVYFNDRLGKYHQEPAGVPSADGVRGGVVQDFNGDGRPDLLLLPHRRLPQQGILLSLYLTDANGVWRHSEQFADCRKAIGPRESQRAVRVADMDLDGDLDIVLFSSHGRVLLNDGRGRFVVGPTLWSVYDDDSVLGAELVELTGDGVPDLLRLTSKGYGRIELIPTKLTPPGNWISVNPTGDRGEDRRTRSPASGYGTRIEVRCGLHSQVLTYTGLSGGDCQSHVPMFFGLGGATRADYVKLTWPDGVTQVEQNLAAGQLHRIHEMERRISSCPVLFAWDGEHFCFIGDFAGVGGLGYYVAPGVSADPQPRELVKIEPHQLAARDGIYELRICEPMEEVAYVDRLELIAVDYPRDWSVIPDERLVITGSPASQRLLCVHEPITAVRAMGPNGVDCTRRLAAVDREYAYQPQLDPRYLGFCRPHTLELDFADRLSGLDLDRPTYLFVTGWIEYPYSQTTYAAAQASVTWEPMRVERERPDGAWETLVADAGAPGGMARTIAIDLSGELGGPDCKLRVTTNLEIYYDRVFVAVDRGTTGVTRRTVPLVGAELRRLGFPLEYSPDGHHPTIYTYDVIQPSSSFKLPAGSYTRYGEVVSLLTEFDDQYAIIGSGDEIAVRFDARALPPPRAGQVRGFVLLSHAYCKDMDLYTATPDTVQPLPFRGMGSYPYPAGETCPDSPAHRDYQRHYNTRVVE